MKTVSLAAVLAAVSITSASAADLIVKVKDVRAFLDDRRPVGQR
jgi:opacity protein-like surface antigen